MAARRGDDRRECRSGRARTAELSPAARRGHARGPRRGGGYDGPLAYRQGKPMRPDVALAFDRMAAAARARGRAVCSSSPAASAPTPSRRALFAAHPDPKWVAPPGRPCTGCAPSSTSGRRRLRWLAANARAVRLPAALRVGAVALRLHRATRAARRSASATRGGDGRATRAAPVVRARRVRAADRAGGAALERRRRAARGPALRRVGLQPVRALAGGRAGHRPVHAGHRRAPTGCATRSTRRRRSTPRRT